MPTTEFTNIEKRRKLVLRVFSKNKILTQTAKILNLPRSIVKSDVKYLRRNSVLADIEHKPNPIVYCACPNHEPMEQYKHE